MHVHSKNMIYEPTEQTKVEDLSSIFSLILSFFLVNKQKLPCINNFILF